MNHEAYLTLKNAIEKQLRLWQRRHRELSKQCARVAEAMRQLSEEQHALQAELEQWPDILAKQCAASLKQLMEQHASEDQTRIQDLEEQLESSVPLAEVEALRKSIKMAKVQVKTLQEELEQVKNQGQEVSLKEQLSGLLSDAGQTQESLLALVQTLQAKQAEGEEADAAAAALQFLEEVEDEEEAQESSRLSDASGALRREARQGADTLDESSTTAAVDIDMAGEGGQGRQENAESDDSGTITVTAAVVDDWKKRIQQLVSEKGYQKQLMGFILVKAGLISDVQLEVALELQRNKPHSHLGELLIELGVVTPEMIALVLAAQCRVDYVRLCDLEIAPEAVSLISERLARQHCCIPIQAEANTLELLMVNPMDLVAIEDVECATNRKVNVLVATEKDVLEAIDKYYWEPE